MYCSIDDILKDFSKTDLIQLANDENRSESSIDLNNASDACTIRILEQIQAADDEIDGYLRSKYTLPLVSVPQRIRQLSKDISIYNVYKRRHRLDMPDTLVGLYKMAVSELDQIRKGFVSLESNSPSETIEASEIRCNKTQKDKIFNSSLLGSY